MHFTSVLKKIVFFVSAKPRIGVLTDGGDALGFVFVSSLNLPISQLREAIIAQVRQSFFYYLL